jgi:glycosyltransferase involved in cell wall biosynthesis
VAKVSVLIPSRNERFLVPTVKDLLSKARGDVEVLVALDGYWELGLPADTRLKILHRGTAFGMRPAINALAQMATGDYLMKLDAHCMVDEGFDVKLVADYQEDNWVLVPRRYALDAEAWSFDTSNGKYPIDYHFLSTPVDTPGDSAPGFHGSAWTSRREARKAHRIDDEMSSQGSCYFLSKRYWEKQIGPLDVAHYGSFTNEFQEVGLRAWLSGGAVKVTKNTYYAHLRKGKRYGRGYSMEGCNHANGNAYCSWFWSHDAHFPGRVHGLQWLIEQFWPVPSWQDEPGKVLEQARLLYRNPYAVAA